MPSTDIGIDLGTATTSVYVKGKGVTITEPAVVAYDKDQKKIRAIGEEARALIGHTPGNIMEIRPLKGGVISDFVVIERMIRHYINRGLGHRGLLKPYIVICVPSGVTDIEKRAVEEAAYQAGARDVTLVKEPIAAALGAGLDIFRPCGNMIVNIGGGTTEIAVLSLGGIVAGNSLRFGGDSFDEAIVQYAREIHELFIGAQTAETIKKKICVARRRAEHEHMEVSGRNIATGLPKTISITSDAMRAAVEKPLRQLVEAITNVLASTPPDLTEDIMQRGIVLTGGGAILDGLEEAIERGTGVRATLAEDPITAVARGTGAYLRAMTDFERTR